MVGLMSFMRQDLGIVVLGITLQKEFGDMLCRGVLSAPTAKGQLPQQTQGHRNQKQTARNGIRAGPHAHKLKTEP